MSLYALLNPVLLLITIAAAGFIISKRIAVTEDVKKFVTFIVINLALPSVVVQSIFSLQLTSEVWTYITIVFITGICLNLSGIAIGYSVTRAFRYSPFEARQGAVLAGLGNTGFIGIPLLALMLGAEAGAYAAIYDATTMFTVFTLGIVLLQRGRFQLKQMKSLFNTPFITLVVSISLISLDLSPAGFVMDLTEMLAALSAPLAMIYIGLLLGGFKLKSQVYFRKFLVTVIATKVLFLPLLAFVILLFLDLPQTIKQVIIIQSGMPSFLVGLVLIERYKGNVQIAITVILATAVIYLGLVPLLAYFSYYL